MRLDHGEPYDIEIRFITAQGKHLWTRTICQPEIINGKAVRLLGTFQDITDRKQAEEALKESRHKYQSIVDNIGIGVALISPKMEIIELNRQMRTWFPDIDPSKHPICYRAYNKPPRDKICDYCPTCKTVQDGKVHEGTTVTPTGDGPRNYRIVSSPIFDEQGKVTASIEMVEDLTERLTLEKQLRQAQKMEAIGTLAGGIAHDFNNILAAMVGYTELALDDIPEGLPARESLEQVLKSGLRAKKLVQQILSFGRRTDHETRPIEIGAVIKETMKLLRATLPSTIEIIQEVEDRPYTVLADSTQIHQVLMNLCTNAAYAMRERVGVLKVSLKPVCLDENSAAGHVELSPGAYTRLTVSDTGEGMNIETLGRVFEPFFSTKEIGQGTGMGLAVVHGIVKAHGGAITVYSEPGKGSTFHVYLPLLETEEEKAAPGDAEPLPTGTEHILFVDDEETLADIGRQMLERLGYQITRRTSSLEALEIFKETPDRFHLVITDQTMPKMSGLDLAKKILSIRPDIPIIICTGYSSQISAQKAEAMGVKRVLMKPWWCERLPRQ